MIRQHQWIARRPRGLVHDRLNRRYLSNHAYFRKRLYHYSLLTKIRYQHWDSPTRRVHQRPAYNQARIFPKNCQTLQKATGWQQPATHCTCGLVCWSLTSLCHSNGHIETMPAREINPFTALTRIRSQFLRTQ